MAKHIVLVGGQPGSGRQTFIDYAEIAARSIRNCDVRVQKISAVTRMAMAIKSLTGQTVTDSTKLRNAQDVLARIIDNTSYGLMSDIEEALLYSDSREKAHDKFPVDIIFIRDCSYDEAVFIKGIAPGTNINVTSVYICGACDDREAMDSDLVFGEAVFNSKSSDSLGDLANEAEWYVEYICRNDADVKKGVIKE